MNNSDIAAVLEQVADLLEFQGANPFRIRAYRNGARIIQDLPEPVTALRRVLQRRPCSLLFHRFHPIDICPRIATAMHGECDLRFEAFDRV